MEMKALRFMFPQLSIMIEIENFLEMTFTDGYTEIKCKRDDCQVTHYKADAAVTKLDLDVCIEYRVKGIPTVVRRTAK